MAMDMMLKERATRIVWGSAFVGALFAMIGCLLFMIDADKDRKSFSLTETAELGLDGYVCNYIDSSFTWANDMSKANDVLTGFMEILSQETQTFVVDGKYDSAEFEKQFNSLSDDTVTLSFIIAAIICTGASLLNEFRRGSGCTMDRKDRGNEDSVTVANPVFEIPAAAAKKIAAAEPGDDLSGACFDVLNMVTVSVVFIALGLSYVSMLTSTCRHLRFIPGAQGNPGVIQVEQTDITHISDAETNATDIMFISGMVTMYLSFALLFSFHLTSDTEKSDASSMDVRVRTVVRAAMAIAFALQLGFGVRFVVVDESFYSDAANKLDCDAGKYDDALKVFVGTALVSGGMYALLVIIGFGRDAWKGKQVAEKKSIVSAFAAEQWVHAFAGMWLLLRVVTFPVGIALMYADRVHQPHCEGTWAAMVLDKKPDDWHKLETASALLLVAIMLELVMVSGALMFSRTFEDSAESLTGARYSRLVLNMT